MSDRDPIAVTRETYAMIAERYLERTRDRSLQALWLDAFAARAPGGGRVCDVGAGPGYDAAELRARGLRAMALDGSMEMLRAGAPDYPGPRVQADMRWLPLGDACLDGVWANATLLHLPREMIGEALSEMRRVLVAGGVLHLSVKLGEGAGWDPGVYEPGHERFFTYWTDAGLDEVLEAAGFAIEERWTNPMPRTTWLIRHARAAGDSIPS
jgi:ubiquinone/menaquinone biosynthesis C-methylase UbiE